MITTEANFDDFWSWLQNNGSYQTVFSYEGAKALFEYLEQLSDDIGKAIDFDPIAWCVEYSEYTDLIDLNNQLNDIYTLEDLENNTVVVSQSPLVIQDF